LELAQESVWHEQYKYEDAELEYHHHHGQQKCGKTSGGCLTGTEKKSADRTCGTTSLATSDVPLCARVTALEADNLQLRKTTASLEVITKRLEDRLLQLEKSGGVSSSAAPPTNVPATRPTEDGNDEDDFELFGDEEEDEEAERVKQERVKAYEDKKAKKPVLIAKSNIILDVKPWDDETDMAELEKCVRSIEMDGLLWGSSKLVPLAYTIKKLQISCVVEDDKVSTEDLEEKIVAFEDYVQSIDIAAFNKI